MSWIKTSVGAFCPFVYGKAIKKQEQLKRGFPVYGSNGVYTYSASELVGPNAVIIGRKGTVGKVHLSNSPCWVSDTAFYVKYDYPDDAYFTYYLLSTLGLENMNTDAAVPGLNRENAHRLEIQVPGEAEERRKIVSPLIAIDKKIKNNKQINQTLEQMAQALFKSWFVDFEPVKAKITALEAGGSQEDATLAAMTAISGKDANALTVFEREHSEQYAELKATADLFPSAMQESELGDIPEGWNSQRFSNIATLHYGKALKKTERIEGPYSVYGSGGITGSHNSYLVEGPSIIVGRKGSIGTLYWEDGKFHPIDTVYYVSNKDGVPLSYLYYLMKTLNLSSMNTDAAVPGLNRDNVYRLEVLKPIQSILNKFNNHILAIRNMIQKNNFSIATLTTLRDTLLPKLLSGEIPLPEAEQAVSEAENV
ncbi:restriction endonuclease subunit S [Yersinia enterocolitica]|nr:restriction endonuclease subunit S [Yersinia enterocolitica]ELW9025805.1 restriction endonuclease subunit S [Yersinia enterocolitica]